MDKIFDLILEKLTKELTSGDTDGNTFNYAKALVYLPLGMKISNKRWGSDGKVYIRLANIFNQIQNIDMKVIVLTDTTRGKAVPFTPTVENQFDDEWFVVK